VLWLRTHNPWSPVAGGALDLRQGDVAAAIAGRHPDAARDPAITRWLPAPVAVAAVKAWGRSDCGQKTMLDVLVPLQQALASTQPVTSLGPLALAAAAATTPMLATRGRASFLGERSIGHMDPGARSSALMLVALLEALPSAAASPPLTP
jgi:hypothetical protein